MSIAHTRKYSQQHFAHGLQTPFDTTSLLYPILNPIVLFLVSAHCVLIQYFKHTTIKAVQTIPNSYARFDMPYTNSF